MPPLATYPVCSDVAHTTAARPPRPPASTRARPANQPPDPTPPPSTPSPGPQPSPDAAQLLQTLLRVQHEFQAEQSLSNHRLDQLSQQSTAQQATIAQLRSDLQTARDQCAAKDDCLRDMERERADWLDVLQCVRAMHGEMAGKMEAMKRRSVKRLMDVAKGRARVV